eukprot:1389328-Amorphochlora_amoeboformis.AAC.1
MEFALSTPPFWRYRSGFGVTMCFGIVTSSNGPFPLVDTERLVAGGLCKRRLTIWCEFQDDDGVAFNAEAIETKMATSEMFKAS